MPKITLTADENGNFQSALPEKLTSNTPVTIRTVNNGVNDEVTVRTPRGLTFDDSSTPIDNYDVWLMVSGSASSSFVLTITEDFPQEDFETGFFEILRLDWYRQGFRTMYNWMELVSQIILPNNLPNIPARFFANWEDVAVLTIGFGTTSIGAEAFKGMTSLNEIICLALTPPSIVWGSSQASFNGVPSGGHLRVPEESVDLYRANPAWQSLGFTIEAI